MVQVKLENLEDNKKK